MTENNLDSPGARLRHVRKTKLKLTQAGLAKKLKVTRSLIPMMETGKQGVSQQTTTALMEICGVNPSWLLGGSGPMMLGLNYEPSHDIGDVIRDPQKSYSMGISEGVAGLLFLVVENIKAPTGRGQYGYLGLSGIKLRLHAAKDKALDNSMLYQLVENEQLWLAAGEPDGWEFEVLRAYFAAGRDHSADEWMECLRMLRWIKREILAAYSKMERSPRAKSA